jgi:hypothetical protein
MPIKLVLKRVQEFLPLTGVSTLPQKHCNKKQETAECVLRLCGYIYYQSTYTPLWGDYINYGLFFSKNQSSGFLHLSQVLKANFLTTLAIPVLF